MEHISQGIEHRERTLIIESRDHRVTGGFTQVPNAVLKNKDLSFGAKTVYGLLLSYAWHNNEVFPGQDRIAADAGATRQTINKYIQELVRAQLVSIRQRGMGKTAIYTLHEIVDKSRQGDS